MSKGILERVAADVPVEMLETIAVDFLALSAALVVQLPLFTNDKG